MYRYTLAKNDQNPKCTGTGSRCTGTHHQKLPIMCVFHPFFHTFPPKSTLHFKHTSKPFQFHLEISFLFNSSFNFISFFKNPSWISSKTLLIWVMTHIQTKHQDLLAFVLNPNSISFHLTMNPTTKGGFHTYVVPYGVLPTLNSRNPRLE